MENPPVLRKQVFVYATGYMTVVVWLSLQVYQPLVDNQVVETTPVNCSCMAKMASRDVKVVVGKQHGGLIRCWVQRLEKNVKLWSRPMRVTGTSSGEKGRVCVWGGGGYFGLRLFLAVSFFCCC